MINGIRRELYERIDYIAEQVLHLAGENPIAFLDAGAVIDFEREVIDHWKLTDSKIGPANFYQLLICKGGFPLYVTSPVMQEINYHNKNHKLNGKPEISDETIEFVSRMNKEYENFLENVCSAALCRDEVGYNTYWAGLMAFEPNHKKCYLDKISRTDKEQIASAIWARYCGVLDNRGKEEKISSSTIISPDCHISGAVKVLTGPEFGYNNIKVVSSRK